MPRARPTTNQLLNASEDLLSEIEMYGHTAQLLHEATPLKTSTYWIHKTQYFAMLESFAIHARSLMGFFYPSGRSGPGDLHATDYAPSWRGPGKWVGFDHDRTRLHVEIMHLNVNRPAEPRAWNYGRIAEGINHLLRSFLDDVDDELLTTDFKDRAKSAMPNPFGGVDVNANSDLRVDDEAPRAPIRVLRHCGDGATRAAVSRVTIASGFETPNKPLLDRRLNSLCPNPCNREYRASGTQEVETCVGFGAGVG